jgi:hypothetical protein
MLVDGRSGPGDPVTSAIRSASRTTGAAFDYLLNTAMRESALDPAAKAKTSSARGLYQFIESTWLTMVKEEGPKYGLAGYASAIERGADGDYTVRDPIARSHILKLRENPEVASVMAGALAKRNASDLAQTLGRAPSSGELYLAHFLGASGAKRMIGLQKSNPHASAAAAFPEAARANSTIFHEKSGKSRSAAEVFASLTSKHDVRPLRMMPETKPVAVATHGPVITENPWSRHARSVAPEKKLSAVQPLAPARSAFAAEEGPALHSLFRNGRKSESPLSPAVRELWGSFEPGSRKLADVSSTAKLGAIGEPMDLLGHLKPGVLRTGRRTVLGS